MEAFRYAKTDYVDVETGETTNSLVFKRLKEEYFIEIIERRKEHGTAKRRQTNQSDGQGEIIYTTVSYKINGRKPVQLRLNLN